MQNIYLNNLVNTLEKVEIFKEKSLKCKNYDEGIQLLLDRFLQHKKKNSKIFFVGNGGSAAIASHMTADFMKNGGMDVYGLYDNAVTTCIGNDYGYEYIFAKQLALLAQRNDLLVAISSSGNSANIINAIETAKEKDADIITFTGFKPNNKIKQLGNVNVYVPLERYGMVESIHNLILQQVVDMILEKDGIEF